MNSQDQGNQYRPDVDQNAAGTFVIAWNEYYAGESISGRMIDSEGTPKDFLVSAGTTYVTSPSGPAVAVDSGGKFVVVWKEGGGDAPRRVIGRAFDSAGSSVGDEFIISSGGNGDDLIDVSAAAPGEFIVVWDNLECEECFNKDFLGRVIDASGNLLGAEFTVKADAGYAQSLAIGGRESGSFVVAWGTYYSGDYDVMAQRLSGDGSLVGAEFTVNSTMQTYSVRDPLGVAMESDGDFIVAWAGGEPSVDDETGVLARLFKSNGTAVGDEFQVNTYSTGNQGKYSGVKVAYDDTTSEFLVVWSSQGQDGDNFGVFSQRLSTGGAELGIEFQVNTFTTFAQGAATGAASGFSVASGGNGEFVVTWDSDFQDGFDRGIFAQRLGLD